MAEKQRSYREIRFWQRFYARLFPYFCTKIRTKIESMQETAENAPLDHPAEQTTTSTQLSELVVLGMLEKKAEDVVIMDMREVKTAVADYFVICSGNSDTQIDAISESIEEHVRKASTQKPWKREGRAHREWILIDYVDVVVHVFNKEKRKFYGLEELWGDAKIQQITEAN